MGKKYQWNNVILEKKAKFYDRLMLVFAGIALLCLYLLPQAYKMVNMIPIVIAVFFLVLSWQIKSQDKKLKSENK